MNRIDENTDYESETMAGYHDINKMNAWAQLGKHIIRKLITEKNQKRLHAYLKDSSRSKTIRRVCQDQEGQLRDLSQTCLQHLSLVTAPLALISPFHYSGGAELTRFIDGHRQILTLPDELIVGRTLKTFRIDIDRNENPQQLFESVFEELRPSRDVIHVKQQMMLSFGSPFVFLPHLQKLLFIRALVDKEMTARDIFDAYLTSCFGAWLNCRNNGTVKKYVTAFAPEVATSTENMVSFFEVYPEGRVIFLIRNPEDWYRHAVSCEPETYKNLPAALARWNEYVNTAKETKINFHDRVCLIDFSDLVTRTELVMRFLSDFLEIEYQDILLRSTFNGLPMTNLKLDKTEVRSSIDARASFILSVEQVKIITEMTTDIHHSVLSEAAFF